MAHKENIEKHIKTHTLTHAHELAQANKDIDCAHVLCVLYVCTVCVRYVCECVCNFYHLLCLPIFPFGKKKL